MLIGIGSSALNSIEKKKKNVLSKAQKNINCHYLSHRSMYTRLVQRWVWGRHFAQFMCSSTDRLPGTQSTTKVAKEWQDVDPCQPPKSWAMLQPISLFTHHFCPFWKAQSYFISVLPSAIILRERRQALDLLKSMWLQLPNFIPLQFAIQAHSHESEEVTSCAWTNVQLTLCQASLKSHSP